MILLLLVLALEPRAKAAMESKGKGIIAGPKNHTADIEDNLFDRIPRIWGPRKVELDRTTLGKVWPLPRLMKGNRRNEHIAPPRRLKKFQKCLFGSGGRGKLKRVLKYERMEKDKKRLYPDREEKKRRNQRKKKETRTRDSRHVFFPSGFKRR